MKHIKTYEELNVDTPQIGDYVIAVGKFLSERDKEFFLNNIGKIRRIKKSLAYNDIDNEFGVEIYDDNGVFVVDYEKQIPGHKFTQLFYIDDIIFFSNNKEELKLKIDANKYGL